jgi:hypothetical protein
MSLASTILDKNEPTWCVELQRVHHFGMYILAKLLGLSYVHLTNLIDSALTFRNSAQWRSLAFMPMEPGPTP